MANRSSHDLALPQSDVAVLLRLLTGKPVNQGRIAEIETGFRPLPPSWRTVLGEYQIKAWQPNRGTTDLHDNLDVISEVRKKYSAN